MRASTIWTGTLTLPALLVVVAAAAQPAESPSPAAAEGEQPPPVLPAPTSTVPAPSSTTPPATPPDATGPHVASSAPPSAPPPIPWYPIAAGPAQGLQTPPPIDQQAGPTRDMSRDFWQLHLGVRVTWVGSEGYDPFAERDALPQLSLGATRALLVAGNLSLSAGVAWDFSESSSTARGADSELVVHSLGPIAEGRYHVGRDVYALVRVVPHAIHTRARLDDASSPAQLRQNTWNFGLDTTAGAAWNFPRTLGGRNVVPQFWLIGEAGYGWTPGKDLELQPDVDDDDPQARMQLNLGPLALRGFMTRLSVGMTF